MRFTTATLRPSGDAIPYDDRFRDGNRFGRETGTIQPQQAEGTLTLPGDDLTDLSGCFAQTVLEWSLGRGLVEADAPAVLALDQLIRESGGDVPKILRTIVGSPEFVTAVAP